MKLLIALVVLAGARDAGIPATYSLKSSIVRRHVTMPCMGGVAIRAEDIHTQETILSNATFTLLRGPSRSGTVVARLKTDAKGHFSVSLPAGEYCLALGEVEPVPEAAALQPFNVKATDSDVDLECLAELKRPKCDSQLQVPRDAHAQVVISSSNQCPQQWAQPCYRGPMPP